MGELDITCPLHISQEFAIEELNGQIAEAASAEEKVSKAWGLMREFNVLLLCENCDKSNPQCIRCHNVTLRRKAELEVVLEHEKKLVSFINKLEKCLSNSTELNLLIRVLDMRLQSRRTFTNRSQSL